MKIGVVIPARNEEKNLQKTLASLFDQTIKPAQVILVNDNSVDNTKEVAKSFGCHVVDFPYTHENWLSHFNLAAVKNEGFRLLENDLDYIMILGADHILPSNYIEKITARMDKVSNLVIASGMILGEWATVPRGSGRVIKSNFWKMIGCGYPMNWGYEGYILYKALSLGYEIEYYSDIQTTTQRKSGMTYRQINSYNYGRAMKTLGYSYFYSLGRCFVIAKRRGFKHGFAMMKGYRNNDMTLYEKELTDFVKESHRLKPSHLIRLIRYMVKA